ncbi:hypothetical protein [Clostridium sp. UBA1652]|uniref:hypothetical protein n=1 Tax=Clostridium sp. UBA1652 TaxID=1946348 RepID=UPI00257DFAD8|nr:hypothetical protein [Clostridium sp. UBA1652]
MLYEYEINENLSMKDVERIYLRSKVARSTLKNVGYLMDTIGTLMLLVLMVAITKFIWSRIWNNGILIMLVIYIISMCILAFSSQKSAIKNLAKRVKGRIGTNHNSININNNNKYVYKGSFTVELSKEKVRELIVDKNCILIFLLPRKFKSFIMVPILIPKNIFESKEELDRFINTIS